MLNLSHINTFLLDMDGTIYLGDALVEGAADFLAHIKRAGKRYIFVTNNSSKNRFDYVTKLSKLGINISPDEIVTSGEASAAFLAQKYAGGSGFILGTASLISEFKDRKVTLISDTDDKADFVLLGFDITITYDKIWKACDYIRMGVPFYATHGDLNCPMPNNGLMPDTGAMIKMFEAATGVSPNIIGKPYAPIFSFIKQKFNFTNDTAAMIGDRTDTDVLLGQNNDVMSVLVLSGATDIEAYKKSGINANFVIDSVKDIMV
ncbi:MAG: HAD-IIA family hydrolase [Defluviitaleaceae bacterium]|nr:HAD-IIA family hydrolase [Defluviitaleaceae bacterium]